MIRNPKPIRPCIEFALIDVENPTKVADFMIWLDTGKRPEEFGKTAFPFEKKEIPIERYLEYVWFWNAPRHRILKLLWQLLQGSNSEDKFFREITLTPECLREDAERCAEILPDIQQRLRWVLAGIEERSREDQDIGQGNWGEEFLLSEDRAEFIRSRLRKVHIDLLEQSSDYQEMLQTTLDYAIRDIVQFIDIPISVPDRTYVGQITHSNLGQVTKVSIEALDQQHDLISVDHPSRKSSIFDFSWGYLGHGPSVLAISLVADALDGDLALAKKYQKAFLYEVVEHFPKMQPFSLSRKEILNWLAQKGLGEAQISENNGEAHKRIEKWDYHIKDLKSKLQKIESIGGLRAQRFDYIPEDFETALYVDLMEMLKLGGRILRCTRCGLPISYDGTSRSNRQRARWESGKPIYHDQCGQETRIERKRAYWHQKASDPEFKDQRRYRARNIRRADKVRELVSQGEGQRIEFKQSFASQNEAIISLNAFTHTDGGTVLFGVKNDNAIVGVEVGNNTVTFQVIDPHGFQRN